MFHYGFLIFPLQDELYSSQPMGITPLACLKETGVKQNIVKGDRKYLVLLTLNTYQILNKSHSSPSLGLTLYTMQVEALLSPVHCRHSGETD